MVLRKKQPKQMKEENLAKILQNIFEKELELDKEAVENLRIKSLYKWGEMIHDESSRPVCVQLSNKMC